MVEITQRMEGSLAIDRLYAGELIVGGDPLTDVVLHGATTFAYVRCKKALQLNAHGLTPVAFMTAHAAYIEGGAGPYDFSGVGNGGTIKLTIDELDEDTATFNATAGYHTGGLNPSVNISAGSVTSFKIQVDGGAIQTIVLTLTGLTSGAAIAAAIQAAIQAKGGVYAAVTCTYEHAPPVDHYLITSHDMGTGSAVLITNADTLNVAAVLKIGTVNGGTSTPGTGDAVSIHAVTRGEVATLLEGDIEGVTATYVSVLTVTSDTTGKDSKVLAGNGTLNTLIGCPNLEADYGAQGLGFASNMSDANYIVMLTLNGTADPTSKVVTVNSRSVSGFDIVSDGATDADYVDILVIGVAD